MSVRGMFRGHPIAVGLTGRERKVFKRAEVAGYLVAGHRLGMVDHAWEVACGNEGGPCLIVRGGRSTASLTLDLAPAGLHLDENQQRDIRVILFRASCKAPNPTAKGRIRQRIITPTYVYARVPLAWAEATAKALLTVAPSRSRTRRSLAAGQGR